MQGSRVFARMKLDRFMQWVRCIGALAAGVALSWSASIRIEAMPFALAMGDGTSGNDFVTGHEFEVRNRFTLRITALGGFDNGANGFAGEAIVRLWAETDDGGWSMVRSVDVRRGELDSGYRYVPLFEPFEAVEGRYVVSLYLADRDLEGSGADAFGESPWNSPAILSHLSSFGYVQDRVASGGGDWFPDAVFPGAVPQFKGASFLFDAGILEVPDSLSLAGGIGISAAALIAMSQLTGRRRG